MERFSTQNRFPRRWLFALPPGQTYKVNCYSKLDCGRAYTHHISLPAQFEGCASHLPLSGTAFHLHCSFTRSKLPSRGLWPKFLQYQNIRKYSAKGKLIFFEW